MPNDEHHQRGWKPMIPVIIFWCVQLFILVCAILDLVVPRTALAASPSTIQLLRNDDVERVVLAHEVSHLKNRDPGRRIVWIGAMIGFGIVCPMFAGVFLFNSELPSVVLIPLVLSLLLAVVASLMSVRTVRLTQEFRADSEAVKIFADLNCLINVLKRGNLKDRVVALRMSLLQKGRLPLSKSW